ncbi:MAG: Trp biosynthesis-associated membrane protein, partial [Actinomycetes bacterium]
AAEAAASGLALLALATAPAVFAVPPRGRKTLGLAIVAVAVLVGAVGTLGDDVLAWVSVAALVLAGLSIAWRGSSWPALGSRFSSSPGSGVADPASLWRDLDRGKDPTESGGPVHADEPTEPDKPTDPPRV